MRKSVTIVWHTFCRFHCAFEVSEVESVEVRWTWGCRYNVLSLALGIGPGWPGRYPFPPPPLLLSPGGGGCGEGEANYFPNTSTKCQISYELQAGGYTPRTPISSRPLARPPGGPICPMFFHIFLIVSYRFPYIFIYIYCNSLYSPIYFFEFPIFPLISY